MWLQQKSSTDNSIQYETYVRLILGYSHLVAWDFVIILILIFTILSFIVKHDRGVPKSKWLV